MMQMHDAHGILHDARCMMRMALPVHQFVRPAHSQHPFHITNEIAQMKFGFYPREGRYAVGLFLKRERDLQPGGRS